MLDELRGQGQADELEDVEGSELSIGSEEDPDEAGIDVQNIVRSGRVSVLGVPNAGKSSLVNALVGTKVSIVSSKPQTTRQRIMGLALLAPRPGMPPTTQAIFVDTAGIMVLGTGVAEEPGSSRRKNKRLFKQNRLHKAMVRSAWKSVKSADAVWWVLDAYKCVVYGDYMPEAPMLDGIPVGPAVDDAWWMHPEMAEELGFIRRIKRRQQTVHVVLNKVDLLEKRGVDIDEFILSMRRVLERDLGVDEEGQSLLGNIWPTSVTEDEESLVPLKVWLCENLPRQNLIFPAEAVSDVPARVAASEVTREKLFEVLRQEIPYQTCVVNMVWREEEDGTLKLGQRVVVKTLHQAQVMKGCLRQVTESAEQEISETINYGRPVELHFQVKVEPEWEDNEEYYADVSGLLEGGVLAYPSK